MSAASSLLLFVLLPADDKLPPAVPVTPPLVHDSPVRCVAFSPDGKRVATGADGGAFLWDVTTGKLVVRLKSEGHVQSIAFSPDGKTVLTGGTEKTAHLWNSATGEPLGLPLAHEGMIYAVAFSP